ncbi:unnamed protein product [Rotaria magnacalcarata]|uniref:RING-type domain-containing protein n=1 Tax=Rotaria magnacalcarata TaxID=392030 RepID=A0A819DVJ3_9BILA|nr:unnamed protein product [Rotaria magnacalcarata]
MASDSELDRNAIFEKFASIKRMHDEVGKKQTEDYQKRLQKLKEEESNYMTKLLSQQIPNRPQQDVSSRVQNSARRDLFLTSKNGTNQSDASLSQQHYPSYKVPSRSSSHHQDSYDNNDHEWNIDDDIQPLNITDNEILDERPSNRISHDDEPEDSYITAFHQLIQNHQQQQQQQQQMMVQQEQENMLSTIFEASCEEATPMTSLLDVHQQRTQISPQLQLNPISKDNHMSHNNQDDEEEQENEQEEDDDDDNDDDDDDDDVRQAEKTYRYTAPSVTSIDDIPVSTRFSKNENLKYSEYILEKLQTEVNKLKNLPCASNDPSKLAYSYSTVDEILQCSICLNRLNDPRALPCQHAYCYTCLNKLLATNRSRSKLHCPICGYKSSYRSCDQCPKSLIHNQLLDLIPLNYDVEGKCYKCQEKAVLNLCPCCDYHLCRMCRENDLRLILNNLHNIFNACYNNRDRIQSITSINIDTLLVKADLLLKNPQPKEFKDILSLFYDLNYFYQQTNTLPVTVARKTIENSIKIDPLSMESANYFNQQEQINDDNDDDIIYIKTKDELLHSQSQGAKEKRPFLRKRQGLAHFQAPPKRRQACPKTTDTTNNTRNETVKRPSSASSTSSSSRCATTNQRSRANSSSATMMSNRQTSRSSAKPKPTKTINNTNSTKQQTTPISTQSNLLGKVDLDDEDDLLTKYQSRQNPVVHNDNDDEFTSSMNKFNSNIQTMIESKWNAYKTSFQHNEEEQVDDDDDEHLYSTSRQRTSSRSSAIQSKVSSVQPKKDLDEFEKLEQYAEEHPSMISTASFVDKVVFNDDQKSKTVDVFVNRLIHYHKEEHDDEPHDLSTTTNRIRQRKIIPFKQKVETRIEQRTAPSTIISSDREDDDGDDDDDDDDEGHKWDDVEVAKVIPIVADEYNSDSGISSFKTDFPRQTHYQQKKDSARSSDFGDDQSWADRVNPPPLNTLMLNTFPGLRHTVPTPAPTLPPPLPPPPPPASVSEHNQDYSRLVREKAKELEKQIELFEKENAKLQSLCNERNLAIKKLKQDRDEFEKTKQKVTEEFNQMKEDEMKKLKHEKRLFEQHRQQLRDHPDKREREEIELLRKQVSTLQEDLKQRESRWSTTVNRLKERIETLEYENAEVKQEKDIIERKRLELMHQLQTMSKQSSASQQQQLLHEDSLSTTRKSLVELQQTKQRPKSTVPTATSKTQSLPKTMVVRNSEPPTKPKVTSNGRRTPTAIIGVNGIKNNVDTSRKLSSLPATKRPPSMSDLTGTIESMPIPTNIEPPIVISERADSGNGGSDEDSNRFDRKHNEHISPPLSSIINCDYQKTFMDHDETNYSTALDYKSLLTMATRTTSSATTLLQRHQETLSFLDQPTIKRQPLSIANNDSMIPTSHMSMPSTTKSITFKENLSMTTNNAVLEEVRHNDGRVERIKSDLSKQIVFPNGSKQEISADGKQIRVQFYNGDYKEKLSDGRCIYKYASTNTTETEYPDGTHIYEFPNGQIEKHLPDGRQEHILPDKTKNIYLTDGTIISIKTNGEKFIQHPNQTKEVHTDTYKRKLFPNGSILTVFNTGEQEIRYANGKIKIKDAQGNIIIEKKTPTNKNNK